MLFMRKSRDSARKFLVSAWGTEWIGTRTLERRLIMACYCYLGMGILYIVLAVVHWGH